TGEEEPAGLRQDRDAQSKERQRPELGKDGPPGGPRVERLRGAGPSMEAERQNRRSDDAGEVQHRERDAQLGYGQEVKHGLSHGLNAVASAQFGRPERRNGAGAHDEDAARWTR